MKNVRTWASWAFVVVINSFVGTGCLVQAAQADEEIESVEEDGSSDEAGGESEGTPDAEGEETWGLCGPKCTKI